jgi:hypothetical protein
MGFAGVPRAHSGEVIPIAERVKNWERWLVRTNRDFTGKTRYCNFKNYIRSCPEIRFEEFLED